jgi:CxxC motif-containing protein (DUF1111 family)
MGQWAEFIDETDTRLVADPDRGSANVDEKDYVWGDVDNDGDTDLIGVYKSVATTAGRRQNVLFMNENGVLVDRTTQFATLSNVDLQDGTPSAGFDDETNDRDVALADVNGDGWLDIITATTLSGGPGGSAGDKALSHPRIYINLGDAPPGSGNWMGFIFDDADRAPTQITEPRFCAVTAGDIDDDGDADLYFADYQQGGARTADLNDRLWINDGTGYFTDQTELRMTAEMVESSFGMAAAIVDMNGDGTLDIVKDDALSAPTAVSISYNNPDSVGFYNAYEVVYPHSPYHVTVGDLNNDDLMDLVVTDDGNDYYMLNLGNGPDGLADFTPRQTLLGSNPGQFGGNSWIADLNNDGFKDVFLTNMDVDAPSCALPSKVYRNLGNTPTVSLSHTGNLGITQQHMDGVHDVAVFDLNGDGWNDIILGMCDGTSVYINEPPTGVTFSYPQGLPTFAQPGEAVEMEVLVEGIDGGVPVEDSGQLYLSINGAPFAAQPMEVLGPNHYQATMPAGDCIDRYAYYFSADEEVSSTSQTDPSDAPAFSHSVIFAVGTEVVLQDDFELSIDAWTIENDPSLDSGEWERVAPVEALHNGIVASPGEDAEAVDSQILAFVTENGLPGRPARASDLDGGPSHLISPVFDLAGLDAVVSYFLWFYTAEGTPDDFTVWVSNNAGSDWTLVEALLTKTEGWEGRSFLVSEFIEPTAQMRVRFTAADSPSDSVTDAGVDLFRVESFTCVPCETNSCDDGAFCNGVEACAGDSCQQGVNPCGGPCDESTDSCVACIVGAHCDDGLFCNGGETCDGFACTPGTNPCLAKGLSCDEQADDCVGCTDASGCNDDLFCNGTESCEGGACMAGVSPCASDEFCDEALDTCVTGCGSDSECDDGIFCNGQETCSGGQCQLELPPCGSQSPCLEGTQTCNVVLQPRMGGALVGLSLDEQQRFEEGKILFNTVLNVEDGLGPIFNQNSCAVCHSNPIGGSGSHAVTRFGFATEDSFDPLAELGGSLLQGQSISEACAEAVPDQANVETARITPSTLGFGLVEAVEGKSISDQILNPPEGTSGRVHFVAALEDPPNAPLRVGRFGWKAQVATVLTFSGDAALNEMGLTNRLVPIENAPNGDADLLAECDTVPDPEDDGPIGAAFIDVVTDFQRFSAPPPQTPRRHMLGEAVFTSVGCAGCHTPVYRTSGDGAIESALRDQRLKPYSDFLLHDMSSNGDGIADGDAERNEIRTSLLWGLRVRDPLWHDGRIAGGTFESRVREAIELHGAPGSEGAASAATFESLASGMQDAVIAFLDSLGRAEFDFDGDSVVYIEDFQHMKVCFAVTTSPDEICGIADINQDNVVDDTDLTLFLEAFDGNLCDCDGNGQPDLRDIILGAVDVNGDAIPDQCVIHGDVDDSLDVNIDDILCVLDGFSGHTDPPCLSERLDLAPCGAGDALVDLADIVSILDAFAQESDCGCTP